ncbi:hypothetical protein ACFV1W_33500 [Kitasatospora sp. NPDC059648]
MTQLTARPENAAQAREPVSEPGSRPHPGPGPAQAQASACDAVDATVDAA